MRNSTGVTVALTCALIVSICSAVSPNSEPNAVELVRAVRESENWLHRIDNLQLRIEGRWSHSPESIDAKRAELKKQSPDQEPDPERNWDLKPSFKDRLEYTIDFKRKRLRCIHDTPDGGYSLRIWDGKQYTRYSTFRGGHQQYDIESTTKSFGTLFGSMSWPRAQPHSFWWDPVDVKGTMHQYGREGDFKIKGCADYRGVACYVLEYTPEHDPAQIRRWYVGIQDHLLYGRREESRVGWFFEYWTLDYKGVSPGCWIPMTQGYSLPGYDPVKKRYYLGARRDVKVAEARINETLLDDLFQMEFVEGLYVADRRSGKTVIYKYVPEPPSLMGQPLPEMDGLGIKLVSDQIRGKIIRVCLWDMNQRPSRHYVTQLARRADVLEERGVTVIAIQASKVDEKMK